MERKHASIALCALLASVGSASCYDDDDYVDTGSVDYAYEYYYPYTYYYPADLAYSSYYYTDTWYYSDWYYSFAQYGNGTGGTGGTAERRSWRNRRPTGDRRHGPGARSG